jgi:hypothetical protein
MSIATGVSLAVGLALLVFGRKLFWLVGAAIGFVLVTSFATRFLHASTESPTFLIIALAAGVLGGVAAVFVQKIAIRLVGFLAAGFFLMNVAEKFGWSTGASPWIAFILGGIIGAILIGLLFEWALILLSSLTGAFLLVHALHLGTVFDSLLWVVVFIAGVLIQARLKRGKRAAKPAEVEKQPPSKP